MLTERDVPTEVRRLTSGAAGSGLVIRWTSGIETELSAKTLRTHCPCATCLEKRGDTTHQKPLSGQTTGRASLRVIAAGADEELNLKMIHPVGQYALSLDWGDGHNTGIFSYSLLRELANGVIEACDHGCSAS